MLPDILGFIGRNTRQPLPVTRNGVTPLYDTSRGGARQTSYDASCRRLASASKNMLESFFFRSAAGYLQAKALRLFKALAMVTVAQLVEYRIVIPVVAGSIPVGHPIR